MQQLEGKVAIVTGASSGIGEGIVKELVAAGMTVAGLARRVDRVEALKKTLESEKGTLSAVKCDVTKEEDVKNAFAWVEKNLGPPSAVINNAGVLKLGLDVGGIQKMFDTNVVGLAICAKEALNSMVNSKTEGTIININSVAGHSVLPFPGGSGYNASKYAVTALTESLRNEVTVLKANIRITSLSPGAVVSELVDEYRSDSIGSVVEEFVPLPASDIGDCVVFILRAPQRMTISELTAMPTTETSLARAVAASKMLQH